MPDTVAFASVGEYLKKELPSIEHVVRTRMGGTLLEKRIIAQMIDRIKELFDSQAEQVGSRAALERLYGMVRRT